MNEQFSEKNEIDAIVVPENIRKRAEAALAEYMRENG